MEIQSTILCHVLDKIGATGTVRDWMRDAASSLSEIYSIASLRQTECPAVFVGSLSDGTYRMSCKSDVDILHFFNDFKSYESKSSAKGKTYCIFEYIDSKKPGYIYLNVHGKTTGPGMTIKILPSGKRLLQRNQVKDPTSFINGPATTSGVTGEFDMVSCVNSPWPSIANEWFDRPKPYNWPSEETQQKLRDISCIVVQAAHPDTPEHEKDIEWRLSFTLQENHLMHNLNDTQYKCYVLLKMVKHDLITAKFGESLTSYHCKTALFYTIEQFPESIWRPKNLIQCLVLCLLRLYLWTLVEFCPHYFMSTVDLFLGKVDKQIMPEISETLQNIITNPVESLKKLTSSSSGIMFTIELSEIECGPELKKLEETAKNEMIHIVHKVHDIFRSIISFIQTYLFNFYSEVIDIHLPLLSLIELCLNKLESDKGKQFFLLIEFCLNKLESDKGKQFFLHQIVPSFNALLASTLVAKSFRSDYHTERDWLLGAAALNFMYALDGNNNIEARLRLANVLYATGHRESAASKLDEVQCIIETYRPPSMTQEEVKTMTMFRRFGRFIQDMGQSDINTIFSTPLYTMINMFPDIGIAFNINETEIVPKCFVFELFQYLETTLQLPFENPHKFDVVNFHMYLTYLVKGDCESLLNSLPNEDAPVALYIFGWKERERGQILRAAQFFYLSWKVHEDKMSRYLTNLKEVRRPRPFCAAILHMLVLMYEVWRDRK